MDHISFVKSSEKLYNFVLDLKSEARSQPKVKIFYSIFCLPRILCTEGPGFYNFSLIKKLRYNQGNKQHCMQENAARLLLFEKYTQRIKHTETP